MAIKRTDLDSDLKPFYDENGAPVQVTKTELNNALFVNQDTALAAGETAERVKKFFDFMPLHVFLPWINAVVAVLNAKAVEIKNNKTSCDSNLQAAVQALNEAIAKAQTKADDAFDQANLVDSSLSGFKNGAYEDDKAALSTEIAAVRKELHALADSDDTTLDQLSEIVAYIKANKTLIDAVTTAKVSVESIVDNLATNDAKKVLSAAQGVALKRMVDSVNERFDENPPAAGAFYVTVTEIDGVFSADKTSEEIIDAYDGGAAVFCVYTKDGGHPMVLHLRSIFSFYGSTAISFSECYESGINTLTCSKSGGKDGWNSSFLGFDHSKMINRDLADQHPIEAIKGLKGALDNKVDKPSDVAEVIVDNQDGEDSNVQSFVYTLPTDNTVVTVDGWGYPDHIIMDASFDEYEGWRGDNYSLQTDESSITLPDCLSEDAKAQWKAGSTIVVNYNSDIITHAVATHSDNHATESYVNAKIEELKKLLGY